jgi:hypothetical protein
LRGPGGEADTHNEVDMAKPPYQLLNRAVRVAMTTKTSIAVIQMGTNRLQAGDIYITMGAQRYIIAMNGYSVKYICHIVHRDKKVSKRNCEIWYNINMYPLVDDIGTIWVVGLLEPANAAKIPATFVGLDSQQMLDKVDRILADYVIAKVGDELV